MASSAPVKILIGYHKPARLFKSNILVPVQGGRACCREITKDGVLDELDIAWLANNTLGDDTGDNWSAYNRYINELTVVYWAWKNYAALGNPEYIGFMQYGKHLILNPYMEIPRRKWSAVGEAYCYAPQEYAAGGNLSEKCVLEAIKGWDILCTEKGDVKAVGASCCAEQLNRVSEGRGRELLALAGRAVQERWPRFVPYMKELEENSQMYLSNLFIMRRELFFGYGEFIFDVLRDVLNGMDLSGCDAVQKRAPGFLGEFLTSVYLRSCEKECRIKTCKTAVLSEPSPEKLLTDVVLLGRLKRSWWKYRLLTHITWGKVQKNCRRRKHLLAQRIERAEAYFNRS